MVIAGETYLVVIDNFDGTPNGFTIDFNGSTAVLAPPPLPHDPLGIGTDTPDPSTILDMVSTQKGFLPPRMSSAQRDAITSPSPGLTIFNTTDGCLNLYTGSNWRNLCRANIDATFTAGSLACTGALAGTYSAGTQLSAANIKTVTVSVARPGSYQAVTGFQNGSASVRMGPSLLRARTSRLYYRLRASRSAPALLPTQLAWAGRPAPSR